MALLIVILILSFVGAIFWLRKVKADENDLIYDKSEDGWQYLPDSYDADFCEYLNNRKSKTRFIRPIFLIVALIAINMLTWGKPYFTEQIILQPLDHPIAITGENLTIDGHDYESLQPYLTGQPKPVIIEKYRWPWQNQEQVIFSQPEVSDYGMCFLYADLSQAQNILIKNLYTDYTGEYFDEWLENGGDESSFDYGSYGGKSITY